MITRKGLAILFILLMSVTFFVTHDVSSSQNPVTPKNPLPWLMLLLGETGSDISTLVDAVDQENLFDTLSYLASFSSRASYEVQEEVIDFIGNELENTGATIRLHEYEYDRRIWHNLMATIPGNASLSPSEPHLVVGAHIDTVPSSPGADDNASGVSAIMEAARVLAGAELLPIRVDFVFLTLEEIGAVGSSNYAADVKASGEVIKAMIAVDMVAFGSVGEDLDLATKPSMAWIAQTYKEVADTYTELDTVLFIDETCG